MGYLVFESVMSCMVNVSPEMNCILSQLETSFKGRRVVAALSGNLHRYSAYNTKRIMQNGIIVQHTFNKLINKQNELCDTKFPFIIK